MQIAAPAVVIVAQSGGSVLDVHIAGKCRHVGNQGSERVLHLDKGDIDPMPKKEYDKLWGFEKNWSPTDGRNAALKGSLVLVTWFRRERHNASPPLHKGRNLC